MYRYMQEGTLTRFYNHSNSTGIGRNYSYVPEHAPQFEF